MKGVRLAGSLWLVGGVMSVVLTIVFRTDALQWVLTIASGLVAAVLGLWLSVRPNTAIVPWSIAVGIAWLIIYAVLTTQQAGELVAWSTDVFLAVIGVAAAVVAYAAARVTPTADGPPLNSIKIEIKGGQLGGLALKEPFAGPFLRPIQIRELWSGARDLNPGPHGPELCDLLSRNVGNDRFQFEISDPASLLVQNWVSLRPNYYMKYYRPGDRSCRRWPCPFSSA